MGRSLPDIMKGARVVHMSDRINLDRLDRTDADIRFNKKAKEHFRNTWFMDHDRKYTEMVEKHKANKLKNV